jgi:conjugative relaxase-like TrwC/TraI family protein
VLSIGKLAAGQAKHYLDQAEGRVDVVSSVAGGLEDYYVGGLEASGEWLGQAARELGLGGLVEGESLRRVLAGVHPRDAEPLRNSAGQLQVAGFDLTFSAPKSVSVLFGVGTVELRGAVREAHDRAVREAVGYMERSAAAVRRGHGGVRVEGANGLVAAAFRHRTSRVGDPQLHTHVLVANVARGPDGRWSALDGRRIYAHARAASFVYQAVLRGELTRALGIEWLPVRKGIAEVAGVPRPVRDAFSRRRVEIEAAMTSRGSSGAHAAEAAALSTRRAKNRRVKVDELASEWRATASRLGFGPEEIERLLGRVRSVAPRQSRWDALKDRLAGPIGLTRARSTFSRRDVIQALCEGLPAGASIDAATLERVADEFLGSDGAVRLVGLADDDVERGETFRRRDGRMMPVSREDATYSTPELLATEQRLVDRALRTQRSGAGVAGEPVVQAALVARPGLSAEQREMVTRLCLDGDGVSVVVGKGGTGKTFALDAAREAWQTAGHPVLGVAVARRAARELESGAGISSTSIAALLADLRRRERATLSPRCVLVVDEAGMVSTRDLAALVDHTDRAEAKLVLVGDHRQLPAIEAGGVFRGLVNRGLAIELHENRRQVEAWERTALDHLREGRPDEALPMYRAHERLVVGSAPEAIRGRLVADWWGAGDPDGAVMIARGRDDVADLNARARELMRGTGAIGREELQLPGGSFAVGDRVVIRQNDRAAGVSNGESGRVVAVDRANVGLSLDCGGRSVRLDAGFLLDRTERGDPTLQHGYAITGHIAQGLTTGRAFVLADPGVSREWLYTAMSRGRLSNTLYMAGDPPMDREEIAPASSDRPDPLAQLAAAIRRSDGAVLAIDAGERAQFERAAREAAAERARLAASRLRWLPGHRERLDAARLAERDARSRLAAFDRRDAERAHASRPAVDDERQTDAVRQRLAERRFERSLDRDLGMER